MENPVQGTQGEQGNQGAPGVQGVHGVYEGMTQTEMDFFSRKTFRFGTPGNYGPEVVPTNILPMCIEFEGYQIIMHPNIKGVEYLHEDSWIEFDSNPENGVLNLKRKGNTMKVEIDQWGGIILKEIFNGIELVTADKESFIICMRDSGFEFKYGESNYSACRGELIALPVTTLGSHQERVAREACELNTKVEALDGFIKSSTVFENLPTNEKILLCDQFSVMETYLQILRTRIENFPN